MGNNASQAADSDQQVQNNDENTNNKSLFSMDKSLFSGNKNPNNSQKPTNINNEKGNAENNGGNDRGNNSGNNNEQNSNNSEKDPFSRHVESVTRYFENVRSLLIVGDGDLSFAASAVAEMDDPSYLTGTVYETANEFHEKYGESEQTKIINQDGVNYYKTLINKGAKCIFNVDATALDKCEALVDRNGNNINNNDWRPKQLWDIILFNFPFPVAKNVGKKNALVNDFMKSARDFVKDDGEIHIALVNKQWRNWDVETLKNNNNLFLADVRKFDKTRWEFYGCRHGDEREFGAKKACYVLILIILLIIYFSVILNLKQSPKDPLKNNNR
jgi:hypothetical protein